MPIPVPLWYPGYVTGRGVFRRHFSGLSPASQSLLRLAAEHLIGAAVSGPVCSSHEVGASCVTAPVPAGRPPAPPLKRNPYGPAGSLRPVEWYAQPWYASPREVLP
jgi:hypothetical protein